MTDPNPNSDLATMDFTALTLEYERLKEKGRRASASDDNRASVHALDDDDLRRLTAIIQIKRTRSGAAPKEPAASKGLKPICQPRCCRCGSGCRLRKAALARLQLTA